MLIILSLIVWYHLTGGWVTIAYKTLFTIGFSMVIGFTIFTKIKRIDLEVMLKAGQLLHEA